MEKFHEKLETKLNIYAVLYYENKIKQYLHTK